MEVGLQIYINYFLFFFAGIMVVSAVYSFEEENYDRAVQYSLLALLDCLVTLFLPFS